MKRLSQLRQIEELRDEEMYEDSESLESPDVAPKSPEPAKEPIIEIKATKERPEEAKTN